MRVFIGYDEREHEAYRLARFSLLCRSPNVVVEKLDTVRLQTAGLYTRPMSADRETGQLFDKISEAPMSTMFAISRFFVPLMQHSGWALFADCDVVFLDDVRKMLCESQDGKAVYVVKHRYDPKTNFKMDGQVQTAYPRKNWSSVMLVDCSHPAHRRLTLRDLNHLPGRDLHNFSWLRDDEIGELDPRWNWLVGEQPRPEKVGIAHFTLGGPWFKGWAPREHDDIWLAEKRRFS
jgi:hypothetical protein